MANYMATARTNYFRVTDEAKWQKLFEELSSEDNIEDFTKEKNGVTYHGFGAYSSIDYLDPKTEDQVNVGDVKTYMMDDIDFDPQALPFGAEDCGCYINGILN